MAPGVESIGVGVWPWAPVTAVLVSLGHRLPFLANRLAFISSCRPLSIVLRITHCPNL